MCIVGGDIHAVAAIMTMFILLLFSAATHATVILSQLFSTQ
jgi:hypothetical protein